MVVTLDVLVNATVWLNEDAPKNIPTNDVADDAFQVTGLTPLPLLNAAAPENINPIVALLASDKTRCWLKLLASRNMESKEATLPVLKASGAAPVLPTSPLLNAVAP